MKSVNCQRILLHLSFASVKAEEEAAYGKKTCVLLGPRDAENVDALSSEQCMVLTIWKSDKLLPVQRDLLKKKNFVAGVGAKIFGSDKYPEYKTLSIVNKKEKKQN